MRVKQLMHSALLLGLLMFLCPMNAIAEVPSERTQVLRIGETSVELMTFGAGKPGPVYVHLHQNERTAITAAKRAVDQYGGQLVRIKSTGERHVTFTLSGVQYQFDPNRMFSEEGVRKTLENYGKVSEEAVQAVSAFAGEVLSVIRASNQIVAVHNNTSGRYSLNSYQAGGTYAADAAAVSLAAGGDPDDFFFVTDAILYTALVERGVSVVLQDNQEATDDGSLSVWCGKNGKSYVNVEAEHGHLQEQLKMFEVLHQVLGAQ